MSKNGKIAVALGGPDTDAVLDRLALLQDRVDFAEVRLDLMTGFDVEALVDRSPVPLIITYRPVREGGRFAGDEHERLAVLHRSVEAGAAFVDVEADSLEAVADWQIDHTRIIGSHHDFDGVPHDLCSRYDTLRERCDVVKLVVTANSIDDNRAVFDLLRHADTPTIAIAMGRYGVASRILAPMFRSCLLTFATADEASRTAPGQLSVDEMYEIGVPELVDDIDYRYASSPDWHIGPSTIAGPAALDLF